MTWLLENWQPFLAGWASCSAVVTTYLVVMFRINPRDE